MQEFRRTVFILPKHIKKLFTISILLAGCLTAFAETHVIGADPKTGSAMARVVDPSPLAHTAQFFPLDKNGQLVGKDDVAKQIEQTLENLSRALRAADARLENAVKINVYATHNDVVPAVEKTFAKKFKGRAKPAVAFVVGTLAHPDALVAMDAVAPSGRKSKIVEQIFVRGGNEKSKPADASILPKGGVVFISGQAKPGDLAEATTKTLEGLQETLKFLELAKSDVVQIKCFIHPASDAAISEKQIAKFFDGQTIPPTVFVDWISANLPIEIELIAAAPENRDAKESVSFITPPEFKPSTVFSKVARVNYGKLVYVSGLYGTTSQNPEQQILEIFDSLRQIVGEAGSDFDSLAKATYYVSDREANGKLNTLRPKFYNPKRPPAASKAMVKDVGRTGMSVTLDMIAVSEK